MAGRGKRDPEREQFWRRTILAWERSGDSIRRFCADRRLSEPSFYAWRRELRKREAEGRATRATTRAGPSNRRPPSPRFIPITLKPPAACATSIEVERGGTTIRLPRDVDADVLARVLEAVHRVPC